MNGSVGPKGFINPGKGENDRTGGYYNRHVDKKMVDYSFINYFTNNIFEIFKANIVSKQIGKQHEADVKRKNKISFIDIIHRIKWSVFDFSKSYIYNKLVIIPFFNYFIEIYFKNWFIYRLAGFTVG